MLFWSQDPATAIKGNGDEIVLTSRYPHCTPVEAKLAMELWKSGSGVETLFRMRYSGVGQDE